MENLLKVSVKNCGNAAGTLGWFNSIINDSEIIIRPTKTGEPGLFLHEKHKKDGTERKENEGNIWICGAESPLGNEGCDNTGIYSHIYVHDNQHCSGFSGYSLTPACEKAIKEFINNCVEKFAEWWEVQ